MGGQLSRGDSAEAELAARRAYFKDGDNRNDSIGNRLVEGKQYTLEGGRVVEVTRKHSCSDSSMRQFGSNLQDYSPSIVCEYVVGGGTITLYPGNYDDERRIKEINEERAEELDGGRSAAFDAVLRQRGGHGRLGGRRGGRRRGGGRGRRRRELPRDRGRRAAGRSRRRADLGVRLEKRHARKGTNR